MDFYQSRKMTRQRYRLKREKGFVSWKTMLFIFLILVAIGLFLIPKYKINIYNITPENSSNKVILKSHNELGGIGNVIIDENKNMAIEIKKDRIINASFNNVKNSSNIEIGIDTNILKLSIKDYSTVKAYAIDPIKINFSNATFVINATGRQLFKCVEYDFEKQNCYGQWKNIMNLIPGKEYKLFITKQDPAFIETNESYFDLGTYNRTFYNDSISAVQLNSTFNKGAYLSQVFDAESLADWVNISWMGGAPYGKELPDAKQNELSSGILSGINMTENVLLLHLDEPNSTIKDTSGSGNNGTSYGGINYGADGKFKTAIKLDGINDKVSLSEIVKQNFTSNFSYGAWFKADSFSTWAGIMSRMKSWPKGYNLQVGTAQKIACGWGVYTMSNSMPVTGKWYQAICVYNGTEMNLYVNGVLQTDIDTKAMDVSSTDMQLGVFYTRSGSGISLPFNGTLDEVFVFNRTLSLSEIHNMYQRGALKLNLSVRSCDDPNCVEDDWNETFEKSSTQTLNVRNDEYFQYKANFFTENADYNPELYNVSIGYEILDDSAPIINLESPVNNTINTTDKTPDFWFNATDDRAFALECSLWMNLTIGGTVETKAINSSVDNGTSTLISPDSVLSNAPYWWWINCSDGYNTKISEKRIINMNVGDLISPSIKLISPANNMINTTNNTPEFRFMPEDDIADTLSCELWLNISGISSVYGTNTEIANGSIASITANSSLQNQNDTWWINCSDGANTNISDKRTIQIYVDVNPPSVSLSFPSDKNNSVDFSHVNFTCSATDDIYLKNSSLYSDYNGDWQFIDNKSMFKIADSATFIKNVYQTNQFVNNHYLWNCLAYDNKSTSNWSSSNYSFSNWDLGSHSNTIYNNTFNAIVLSNSSSNGEYISKVFDAGLIVGWRNISWNSETSTQELPDNKTNADIDMRDNMLLMHLNDGYDATTFEDTSGEGNGGSCSGGNCPTWNKTSKFNGGYSFDGNDVISISEHSSLAFTNEVSYGAWFKADSFSKWAGIMSRMKSWPNGYNLQVGTAQKIACGWGVYTMSNSMPVTGKWYHAVCVYNGSAMKLYVNGILQSDIGVGTLNVGADDLKLGVFYTSNSLYFNGTIDEAFVFNRTLSDQEVRNIYSKTAKTINLSVRSCNDVNCNGEFWSEKLDNSTLSELPLTNNRYFQYKADLEHVGGEYTPKLYNTTINYGPADNEEPTINLSSPADRVGDEGNLTIFSYSVYDESKIDSCELIINGVVQNITDSIEKGITQEFTILKMSAGTYDWNINCTDINGNENSSEIRKITIIPSYEYRGRTTDLNQVDIENITNLILEKPSFGLINFSETINLSGGGDINSFVTVAHNLIRIDSDNLPQLNKSAEITLYNLSFTKPIILKNNKSCSECNIIDYDGNLTFTVPSFSSYSAFENSKLEIRDDTDSKMKYTNNLINFYANYTNRTSGKSINGSGIYCKISFADIGTKFMIFNSSTALYWFNRTFSSAGVYYYNVTCNDTNDIYASLNATDYVSINKLDGPQSISNITVIKSERANLSGSPTGIEVRAGNLTQLIINSTVLTNSWQGYYGTVGGVFYLKDSSGAAMYDWSITQPTGEIYATRAIDVNFADINCSSSLEVSNEEAFIGQESTGADSVRNTFSKNTHPGFGVGSVLINANSCNATNLYVNRGVQDSNFFEVLLSDGASNIVYTALLDPNETGFDNKTYDFEMLVGENGNDEATTKYYFFLEIS